MEGGADNLLMLFTQNKNFFVSASGELYYNTFAVLAALTGNKLEYQFIESNLFLSGYFLWDYTKATS